MKYVERPSYNLKPLPSLYAYALNAQTDVLGLEEDSRSAYLGPICGRKGNTI